LIDLIDCPVWLISTNGRRFHHPDDEALARIVHRAANADPAPAPAPATTPRLVWNYRSDRFTAFTGAFPPASSGYSVDVPAAGAEGIVVRLAD
ncbi:MAG: hypothetical protein QOE93_1341, partial [Actinomycetota bacterium]|nr:hypothetical protein [Actinomycetota bacterium]